MKGRHTFCDTCATKEGCYQMTGEPDKGFCPAHFEIVKEVTTTSSEIRSLADSHDRVRQALEVLRNDIRDRIPPRTVLLITLLSSGFVGLLCIVATHLLGG